ncbi:hypothetical protein FEM48_Zijuj02G0037100 [Ziziphus jujuba var. spinosa]|uniref:Uncharacterized protein n=1 Tax=Ziziphus jujuba var. spinosa TaxID=714518 RepID=A0A978VTF2_ZIZJJ|nr:hypothetical protein FEM48_Zijuj02G0037100 [Ziziphus jujuba var. spinosa]
MASCSKSEPLAADHKEEEAAKKSEKKLFPSQTSIVLDKTDLSSMLHFDIKFYNPNKKDTIYFDNLTASSTFRDKTGIVKTPSRSFNITPHVHPFPIQFGYQAQFWSIYGYMEKYLNQGRSLLTISFEAKISLSLQNGGLYLAI